MSENAVFNNLKSNMVHQDKALKVLSLCCNLVVEINLQDMHYFKCNFQDAPSIEQGTYGKEFIDEVKMRVHPNYIDNLCTAISFDNLKASFELNKTVSVQYILNEQNASVWRECRIGFFEEDTTPYAILAIRDITLKAEAEELARQNNELREARLLDERYKLVVEQTGTIVFEKALNSSLTYISPQLSALFIGNYQNRDVMSVFYEDKVIHPEDAAELSDFIRENGTPTMQNPFHLRLKTKKGHYLWCKLCFAEFYSKDGNLERIIGMLNNEDEAVCSRKMLEYRAQYDILTGVYNAQTFYAISHKMLRDRPDLNYAILRMDVGHFKTVNEMYGIEEGDRVLCKIAAELEAEIISVGICGRLYSDVFVMCVPMRSTEELELLIKRLADAVASVMPGCSMNAYFGVCFASDKTTPTNILCDRAGLALAQVKGSLLKNFAYYDNILHAKEVSERNIESKMEQSLANGEFIIYLQPKHSLVSNKPIGAEALVRWMHPQDGLLSPAAFIPLFERNGFIIKLDEYVWEQVFILIRKWLDNGFSPVPVSVNVSRVNIYNPTFSKTITSLIKKYNIPGYLVELELTETTFVDNQDELYRTLRDLQAQGLNFSIDDFGSGYSSLNMLKNSPADILKLDREFLCAAAGNVNAQTVIRHTISMANQLNMQVVAEGVENETQAKFLKDAGCLAAQGYFYSHPMPVVDYEDLMLYKTTKNS